MMRSWITKGHLVALLLACLVASAADAWADPQEILSLNQLQRLSPCDLEQLYERADFGTQPAGCTRGRVLYLADTRLPRLKNLRVQSGLEGQVLRARWRVYQSLAWIHRPVIARGARPSWYDGRQSLVMEYAPGTPLFANLHDEIPRGRTGLVPGPAL